MLHRGRRLPPLTRLVRKAHSCRLCRSSRHCTRTRRRRRWNRRRRRWGHRRPSDTLPHNGTKRTHNTAGTESAGLRRAETTETQVATSRKNGGFGAHFGPRVPEFVSNGSDGLKGAETAAETEPETEPKCAAERRGMLHRRSAQPLTCAHVHIAVLRGRAVGGIDALRRGMSGTQQCRNKNHGKPHGCHRKEAATEVDPNSKTVVSKRKVPQVASPSLFRRFQCLFPRLFFCLIAAFWCICLCVRPKDAAAAVSTVLKPTKMQENAEV